MLKKRIIPCLDIKDGRTVKGINFVGLQDAGDPVELAAKYSREGADELVFLDITATIEKRQTLIKLLGEVAGAINIPFTVGGGISHVDDATTLIKAGADKVSINSAALKNPELIKDISGEFGCQCVVLAVDTNYIDGEWMVFSHGGRTATGRKTLEWVEECVALGAGEILLTSMVNDGTRNGFAHDITDAVAQLVNVPVIASGGAGKIEHFSDLFAETKASAALAASIFHYGDVAIPDLKQYLREQNVPVR